MKVKVFQYLPKLEAFLCTPEYKDIANTLNLTEWTPVVWIGRLFYMDNDFGEHWHDNWDEREKLQEKAKSLGIDSNELLIIAPDRFKDGKDGPCHSPEIRKEFWTNVLQSLELDFDTITKVAFEVNEKLRNAPYQIDPVFSEQELFQKIEELRKKYFDQSGYLFT